MPVHDWTLVEAGIFHDFHTVWIGAIRTALNQGLLPEGYYALAEQHAGRLIADVLTLHASPAQPEPLPPPPATGGILVAEAPPQAQRKQVIEQAALARRSIAIRHVSGHRLVALLEIASPANKDRPESVEEFAAKAVSALDCGVHVLVVDLFPPGRHDPKGMHEAIRRHMRPKQRLHAVPSRDLVSYVAGPNVEIFSSPLSFAGIPEMPVFLQTDQFVNVPLQRTYQEAYLGMPAFWARGAESASHDERMRGIEPISVAVKIAASIESGPEIPLRPASLTAR